MMFRYLPPTSCERYSTIRGAACRVIVTYRTHLSVRDELQQRSGDYTVWMSYLDVLGRIADLQSMIQQVAAPAPIATPTASAVAPTTSFASMLDAAGATGAVPGLASPLGSTAGSRALAAAQTQIGQAEQPPGSNDGPAIAMYRTAVEGAAPGEPWCAYFVSWAAAQAGAPIGDRGQGLGSVAGITDWASRTGRLVSQPQPGDLILFGTRHVGIVQSVNPDGSLTTVEGNASNAVSVEHHSASEATGFVRL
jgi:cell wall-associated NlpC family hydrolase